MKLFTADLYRQFAIGFLAGALIVGVATADQWADGIESPAQAATPFEAPPASDEFQIEPLEIAR